MRQLAAAAGLYLAASLCLFGRNVVLHPQSTVVGDAGADKTLYMWAFEWWPWAIPHGHNPLDVDVAWMPHGFDLGLGTAGGGLALLAAPLTAAGGPVVTYNVLALLAPALAALSAFLLIRLVTRRFTPSLVGGWMFGFSSYEFGHLLGHLPLAFVAPIPLVPYLALRRQRETLSCRRFVALLALVLAVEFTIVTQLFFTLLLVGGIAAVVALALFGRAVRRTIGEAAAATVVAALLVSPILVYAAVSHATAPRRSPFAESADVLGYVVPIRRMWIRPPGGAVIADRFTGTGAELGAYLGFPFVALVLLAAVTVLRRPRPKGRLLLVAVFAATVALALGPRVKIAGVVVAIGPWAVISRLPLVSSALPVRLTVYTSLLAGLLVASALAERPTFARWALAAAGIAATMPNLALPTWSSPVPQPAFFASGRYTHVLPRRSTVLVLPYGPAGWSMLWQAESGFHFRLVGGHFALRVTPQEERWRDVYTGLGSGRIAPARLRTFLRAHRVDRVVVAPATRRRVRRLVAASFGSRGVRVADAIVYAGIFRELASSASACATRRSGNDARDEAGPRG